MKIYQSIIKRVLVALITTLFLVSDQIGTADAQVNEGDYVPGELIIRFRSDANSTKRNQTIRNLSAQGVSSKVELYNDRLRRLRRVQMVNRIRSKMGRTVADDLAVVNLNSGVDVLNAAKDCLKDPNVLYAEPNYIYRINQELPNDPGFDQLWGLHNTGQEGGSILMLPKPGKEMRGQKELLWVLLIQVWITIIPICEIKCGSMSPREMV
jgi:hypothetical protein